VLLLGLLCWLANTASSAGMYAFARARGPAFFTTGLGRKLLPAAALAALRDAYARHGVAGIFFSRFLPGVRAGVTPFAGVVGLPPGRTLVPAALASAIWYAALVSVASALGLEWSAVRRLLEHADAALGARRCGCADRLCPLARAQDAPPFGLRACVAPYTVSRGVAEMGSSLADWLDRVTREGELCERLPDQSVRCWACAHRCLIAPGQRGICKVRFNDGGSLRVPFGYVAGLAIDPIEKKPFFHVLPGARALSFGMLGCDFHCAFCQNWLSSQVLRDPAQAQASRKSRPRT